MIQRLLIFLAAFLCLSNLACQANASASTDLEDKLFAHVRAKGGRFKLKIDRECPICLRGTVASKDMPKGTLIMAIPLKEVAVKLKDIDGDAFAAEYAYHLVMQLKTNQTFADEYKLYFDTLPKQGEVFTGELFEDRHMDMLGSEKLSDLVAVQRQMAEMVYTGSLAWRSYAPMKTALGDKAPTMEEFKHYAALVGSRDFSMALLPGQKRSDFYLVPITDLINHADDPNGYRYDNGTHLLVSAVRDIKKGEQVFNNYQTGVIHRDDMALIIYGFIQKNPVMLASDLPTYTADNPYGQTPEDDSPFYGPKGKYNTMKEYNRLAGLLAQIPSTDEDDQALLNSRSFFGGLMYKLRCSAFMRQHLVHTHCHPKPRQFTWKEAMLLEFRIHRRQRLRGAMKKIMWEIKHGNASDKTEGGDDAPAAVEEEAAAPKAAEDDPYLDPDEL